MTVQTETSRSGPYAGAGTTGPFTVGFRFLSGSHLRVIRTTAVGIDSTLVLDTDYTVSGAGGSTGTVTLTSALAFGEKLTIVRNVPFTQNADYVPGDAFPAESHEDALDLLTMQTQQLAEAQGRALTLPVTVSGASTELPSPSGLKVFGWNAAGTAIENLDANTLASIIAYGTAASDLFDGDGVTTAFSLSGNPASINNLDVSIGGVAQRPGLDYLWTSGTIVAFTTAPAAGTDNILVRYMQALAMGSSVAGDVSYTPAGVGADVTTVQSKLRESVSVLDFGADPTGATDSTAAFNLATRASIVHGGNDDLDMRRRVNVPAGDYMIAGTVYVRKGQTLSGAGDGATRITAGAQTATGRVMFKLGYGLPGGVETQDPGGLPPVIENMHTFGGDTNGGVVDMRVAGAQARDVFMTSCGVGVRVGGGDTIITRCIIDQGLNGFIVEGQNHIINSCLFYNMNYGIQFTSEVHDVQVGDCHFEYGEFNDILFGDGATSVKNVSIADCHFIKNEQFATSNSAINIRCNSAEINIRGCDFRNQRTYSIARTNGIGSIVRVSDCTFNGLKTVAAYDQSTTAQGINTTNCEFEITNCRFENLFGSPIVAAHTFNYKVIVRGCTYKNITGATHFVNLSGTVGTALMYENIGDGVLPLFNTQSAMTIGAKGNISWLGAAATTAGRRYWTLPTRGAGIIRVGISANSNSVGNAAYRKASAVFVSRHIDSTGSAVTDYVTKSTTYETPAGFAPVLDIAVALDAVGGGASSAHSVLGRNLIVSIPDTYTASVIEADYII